MKALQLTMFFLLFTALTIGQTGTIKIKKPEPDSLPKTDSITKSVSFFDVYYGYRTFSQNFQEQLNTTEKFNYTHPLQLISFGGSGEYMTGRNGRFHGHFLYHQVIPRKITINDTINCKITGFVFSAAYGKVLRTKSGNFITMFYLGFNTGSLRLYRNELVRQKNPFFSPKVGIQPKVLIGVFTVSFIAEYEYDVSSQNWRKTMFANNNKTTISKLSQSCLTTLIGINYGLFRNGPKDENGNMVY